jgi:hypothetical protein
MTWLTYHLPHTYSSHNYIVFVATPLSSWCHIPEHWSTESHTSHKSSDRSHSRIFHLYGDVTITGEGLQNLGLCSALRAFEQGGIFIAPHLLWHGAFVIPVSSEGTLNSVASYDTQGMWRIFSNPHPHGSTFSWHIRHTRGCGGPILTRSSQFVE